MNQNYPLAKSQSRVVSRVQYGDETSMLHEFMQEYFLENMEKSVKLQRRSNKNPPCIRQNSHTPYKTLQISPDITEKLEGTSLK